MGKLKISNRAWALSASLMAVCIGMFLGYLVITSYSSHLEFVVVAGILFVLWLGIIANVRD